MSRRLREIPPPAAEPLTVRYTQSRLCDYCGKFIQRVIQACNGGGETNVNKGEDYYVIRGHPSDRNIEAVILSAEQGCWVCNHITSNAKPDNEYVEANIRLETYSYALYEFAVNVVAPQRRGYYETFRISRLEDPTQGIRSLPLVKTGNISTWTFNGLEKAKEWLQECNEQHTECRGARVRFCTGSYPLRLLDVSSISSGSLRLIKGLSLPPNTSYATLSHCWGQVRQSVLLRSLLDAYSQHISTESLPRSHREAAEICADLELNYLWIDSLCIVQDDPSEWATEAPRMAEIYTNSYVTLAATVSQSDGGGLKRPFNLCHAVPLTFSTIDVSGKVHAFKVQKEENFQKYVNRAPLNLRAWVLQERLLSSRILHFANDQIYWQCLSTVDAQFEMTYDKYDETDDTLNPHWRTSMKWTSSEMEIERDEVARAERWDNLTIQYSRCSLSFNSDKLIALSGLAKRIHSLTSWSERDYLAGLWRQGLPKSLLWTSYTQSVGKPNDVPSWSWASVNTDIIYEETFETKADEEGQNLVRIIVATTVPSNDNFGSVVNGKIRLSGSLGKVKIRVWHWGGYQEWKTFIRGQSRSWKHIKIDVQFDHSSRWTEVFGRTIFLLPVLDQTLEFPSSLGRQPHLFGLVLEPTTIKAGQYRRVGYFSVENEEGYVRVKGELAASNLGRKFYIEHDGLDKYVVEIV